jgi:8-oxo-dGTP diphosphatase
MVRVDFYDAGFETPEKLIYSVIAARYLGNWVFVRHHQRTTFEIPGGHIEMNETPAEAATRELMEETGAVKFTLECLNTYSVTIDNETRFGKLFLAEITEIGPVPDVSEIAETVLMKTLPDPVTYPEIQPLLFRRVTDHLNGENHEVTKAR